MFHPDSGMNDDRHACPAAGGSACGRRLRLFDVWRMLRSVARLALRQIHESPHGWRQFAAVCAVLSRAKVNASISSSGAQTAIAAAEPQRSTASAASVTPTV